MQTLDCVIADDEKLARDVLVNYTSRLHDVRVIGQCTDAEEVRTLLAGRKADILFLDIRMPNETGLALLPTLTDPPHVIFTTAYSEYAVSAFDLRATDYLVKPFSFERFSEAVSRVRGIVSQQKAALANAWYIDVRVDRKQVRIMADRIRYIEAIGNYARLHLDEDVILTYASMQKLAETLSRMDFRQVHRSYLVNMRKVTGYTANTVVLGKDTLPVGRHFRNFMADS